MQSGTQTPISKKMLWTGRIISALPALFLLLDGIMKLIKPAPIVEATVRLGYPESVILGLGIVLIASTLLYLIPRTSILGAILLTGYLGGAVATHVRVGDNLFSVLFPVFFGLLIWGGLYLRDDRLRALIPLRSQPSQLQTQKLIGATVLSFAADGVGPALVPLVVAILAAFVAYGRWRLAPHRGRSGTQIRSRG